jgi:hypothetical protein
LRFERAIVAFEKENLEMHLSIKCGDYTQVLCEHFLEETLKEWIVRVMCRKILYQKPIVERPMKDDLLRLPKLSIAIGTAVEWQCSLGDLVQRFWGSPLHA